jgi:hypothetical protein
MSIRSKAKRDARKKKSSAPRTSIAARALVEHAHLVDAQGSIVGGAGLRGDEWVLVLGGKAVAGTESAAMAIAMLQHVASLQQQSGSALQLNYSTHLRDAATAEAGAEGKSLEEYLALLEAERQQRSEPSAEGDLDSSEDKPH